MHHESDQPQSRPRTQAPQSALAPQFTHEHIAASYEQGLFGSRLEAELADLFINLGVESEQPSEPGVLPLTEETVVGLSCIAILHGGQIIPCLDLEQLPRPVTRLQKMELCARAARVVLDALIAVLDAGDGPGESQPGHDTDEGGSCSVR